MVIERDIAIRLFIDGIGVGRLEERAGVVRHSQVRPPVLSRIARPVPVCLIMPSF
jgi:hypothetical protein